LPFPREARNLRCCKEATIEPSTSIRTPCETRLSEVLEAAIDGIIILDRQARILAVNNACERMFGYRAAEMLGRHAGAVLTAGEADMQTADVACFLCAELDGRHRDGSIFPLRLSHVATVTSDGQEFLIVMRDRRRTTRVAAQHDVGAVLAHELTQPLTSLTLYLQAMARASARQPGAALPETLVVLLDKALHEAQRAGDVIRRMRQLDEQREPTRQPVDLAPLVEKALEFALLSGKPGTQVIRALAADLPQLQLDPVQIEQVLVSLLRNALDAAKDHHAPEIRISVKVENGAVVLAVGDNGPGIPAEFYPQHVEHGPLPNGRSSDLAMSKSIAERHGGGLTVGPGENGRGALLKLRLPVPSHSRDVSAAGARSR
jgi:two-component system sensor kinase FixL